MSAGRFITLEGIEGAGKSTSLEFIQRQLQSAGIPHLVTREPGGTGLGEALREILLHQSGTGICVDSELLLMFAARAQHLNERIRPALKWGLVGGMRPIYRRHLCLSRRGTRRVR